ncbi:MAG TPA: glycosyltransferase family 2 protein [Burkholderiales bacterium]|nr:glycosyltransferase family 2 protein [Burkholderiales bacterium]
MTGILVWALSVMLILPAMMVSIECLVACLPFSRKSHTDAERPDVAVLIPAHNESAVIEATLGTIVKQLRNTDRVLVVADNCSDETATIARTCGALVLERRNESLRGKGHALAFGMEALRQDPPEIVIIVDADCQVTEGALDLLAGTAHGSDSPVQSLYLMKAGNAERRKIAAFAWVIKNHVRALGMQRMGIPCQLTGTGMAFPWHIIENMNLATSALVEDMLLGGELVASGHPPVFCPDAVVTSIFPAADRDAHTQRRRWEHGHIGMILNYFPILLLKALKRGDARSVLFATDMMVPPLALQSMLMLAGLGLTGIYALLENSLPFETMTSGFLLFSISLFAAWYRFGRDTIGVRDAFRIPIYMISKISVYLAYLFSRERSWVKTRRS